MGAPLGVDGRCLDTIGLLEGRGQPPVGDVHLVRGMAAVATYHTVRDASQRAISGYRLHCLLGDSWFSIPGH